MSSFLGYIFLAFIILLAYFLFKIKQNNDLNRIERIVDSIVANLYDKDQFYNDIGYLKLKTDDRINNNKRWLIFYDGIDHEHLGDFKRHGLLWGGNPQYSVRHIYIAFYFTNNILEKIHIQFRNLIDYKFSSSYIKEKFKEIRNRNENNIKQRSNEKYPRISSFDNDYSIFIDYTNAVSPSLPVPTSLTAPVKAKEDKKNPYLDYDEDNWKDYPG
jgi:hypothetical protein